MNLSSFLADLDLTELLPVFEAAGVDFDVLEKLTDSDLKEMGIAKLGSRRKIMFALEKTIPINRMDLIAELEEKERLRQTVSGQSVVLTTHRINIGETAFLMGDIKSASVYTHVEPDLEAEKRLSESRAKVQTRLIGGLCVLIVSLAGALFISAWYQIVLLVVLGGGPGLFLLLSALRRMRSIARQEVRPIQRYYLRIETLAGPKDMLMSKDKKELDEIVQSITQAKA